MKPINRASADIKDFVRKLRSQLMERQLQLKKQKAFYEAGRNNKEISYTLSVKLDFVIEELNNAIEELKNLNEEPKNGHEEWRNFIEEWKKVFEEVDIGSEKSKNVLEEKKNVP